MDDDEHIITLTAGDAVVTVHPDAGGRIGQIVIAGQALLIDVPTPADRQHIGWGMFPMAPWAGRIREGRFTFDGVDHQLVVNHHDVGSGAGANSDTDDVRRGHSIHGTVHDRAWTVDEPNTNMLQLECALAGALDWPFQGVVRQHIELRPDRLQLELTIDTNTGRFPAEVGWHPWFLKPDRVDFAPSEMYQRDAFGIPSGALVEPTDGPWDDCFVNVAPIRLRYLRDVAPTLTVMSDCTHTVVFDEPDHSTCVEPQSGPADAFNLIHHVVTPETPLRRSMSITW